MGVGDLLTASELIVVGVGVAMQTLGELVVVGSNGFDLGVEMAQQLFLH